MTAPVVALLVVGGVLPPGAAVYRSRPAVVASQNDLLADSCAAPDHCVAVGVYLSGAGEHTFAQTFNGHSWKIVSTPSPGRGAGLDAVSCPTLNWCLAVGGNNQGGVTEQLVGGSWRVLASPKAAGHTTLTGVSCVTSKWCMAVGNDGPRQNETLAELYHGHGWSVKPVAEPKGFGGSLVRAVSCASVSFCVMTGWYSGNGTPRGGRVLAEVFDGSSWTPTPLRLAGTQPWLNAISCPTAGACVAIGSTNLSEPSPATVSERYKSGTWTRIVEPRSLSGAHLGGIWCASASSCVAVGAYRSGTGAERLSSAGWSEMRTPNPAGASPGLAGLSCRTSNSCVAVGQYTGGAASEVSTLAEQMVAGRWSLLSTPDETL
ncbi:MAG: hypothetical protein ACRDZ6_08250 [Acidimicrobiales bacterium]